MLFVPIYPDENTPMGLVREGIGRFFSQDDYSGKRLLVIVPDNTRSGPVGDIFKMIFELLDGKAARLDVLFALGTHRRMSEQQMQQRLGMSGEERDGTYAKVRFFNHEWDRAETFRKVGRIGAAEIEKLTGGLLSENVEVAVNKLIFDYDEFFIVGPVFPHEVVGFSGGHKYIFPGIAGDEIINFFHWLGAIVTNPLINGTKWTVTRKVVEKAASFIDVPRKLFAIVAIQNKLKALFIGEVEEAWEKAADLSAKVHIVYKDKPYKTILGVAPRMYDDIWTAGKVMYKLEPILADGGVLIIYAPHITQLSYTHGKVLDEIGYHTRDYFLKQWDSFKGYPHGVIAHATHVKGIGTYTDGVEKPRVQVVLATGISKERCERVNLGHMDPGLIEVENYRHKEHKGVLVVDHAGEMLYRLKDGSVPRIEQLYSGKD